MIETLGIEMGVIEENVILVGMVEILDTSVGVDESQIVEKE